MADRPLPVPAVCPNCQRGNVQAHSKTSWCTYCGWAQNRYRDPATHRHTTRPGMESRRRDG